MKPRSVPKQDRRIHSDRRALTRGGRRSIDATNDMQCPACASTDVVRTLLEARAAQYRCRACDESWVGVSPKKKA